MEPAPHAVVGPASAATSPTTLSAAGAADGVASGAISAEELTSAFLRRIDDVDPHVHAFVQLDRERALYAARRIDRARLAGHSLGPLAGVPFVVKDNVNVCRHVTASGSRAHGDIVALRNARVVQRLLEADAVLLGRANMDELALGASTQTSACGPTRNPWDVRRSPGGSSGGSAAAIAAGMALLAVGSDTGGSIREPAAQCGVVGIAPSQTLVPRDGLVHFAPELDRVGPLARTVSDCALALRVMAGSGNTPADRTGRLDGLRVGVVSELCGARNTPGVRGRLSATVDLLGELGAEVIAVSMPDASDALEAYMRITSAACVETLAAYVATGLAGDEVLRRVELGRAVIGTPALAEAEQIRTGLIAQARAALARTPVLISPTMPTPPPFLNDVPNAPSVEDLSDPMSAPYTDCWTVVANLAGLCALSLPAGFAAGLPVGVMLSGAAGDDALVLRVAGALELAGVAMR